MMLEILTENNQIKEKNYVVKYWKRIAFSLRDYQILNYIGEQRFMNLDQICRKFYSGTTYQSEESKRQVAYMRLRKFREFGFLQTSQPFFDPYLVYHLTKNGRSLLINHGIANGTLPLTDRIDSKVFEHDKTLTNCRILLEELLPLSNWKPEAILKAEGFGCEKVPDGIFHLKEKPIAIELEISEKGKSRYVEIFNEYSSLTKLKLILYVVKSSSLIEKLLPLASSHNKIFFVPLEELYSKTQEACFRNVQYSFSLKEIIL